MLAPARIAVVLKPERPSSGRGATAPLPKVAPITQPDDIEAVTPRVI
jgi:hypothetical protein